MKTIKFYAGAAALLAMGALSSCSGDEPMKGQDPGKVEADQTQYMTVAICNPTSGVNQGGRADFQDGSAAESAVNKLVFVFYDGAGNPTATMKSVTGDELADGWSDKAPSTDVWGNSNVTRFWKSTIPVEMTQGQNKPAYVMCYVNPIDETGISTMTLKELEGATRVRIKKSVGGTEYFAMSNSVYYGTDPISGQSKVRMMATPIVDGKLFDTEAEADAATGDDAVVNIFVERYAAKIGLTLEPGNIEPNAVNVVGADGSISAGSIKFTPAYWRPNAIDEETYVTKAFSTSAAAGPTNPATWAEMEDAFKNTGMPIWNLDGDHRSFWACSPSYYANDYPRVSDNITDKNDWETAFPYDLRYFTYNQIANGIDGSRPSDPGIAWNATDGFKTEAGSKDDEASGYFYSRETTASIDNIISTTLNNKAVVASAVIVGNYKLATADDNSDFYLYGKKEGKDNYYGDVALLKSTMLANQSVIYLDENGEQSATNGDWFEIEHPEAAVRGTENVAGRLVTLQLKNNLPENQALYFYDGTTKAYEVITEDNLAAANRLLWKTVSTAQMFSDGLAFFSIPIRHLGFGQNLNGVEVVEDANEKSNVYKWQNMRRGDFGVVRNHVYNLNVSGIKGLGVGLRSADQPIVPPMDPDNYYVAARLNILAWRLVPIQGVEL